MEHRIVVIGAGLAGLTAAATAAGRGASVVVIEAREHDGGRARSTTVDGFTFNQGPHALYRAGAAMPILRSLGVDPQGGQPPVRGVGRLRGRVDRLPGQPLDAVRTRLIGGRDKLMLARKLALPKKLLDTPTAGRSMQGWLDEQFPAGDARLLAAMLARIATYCHDLDRLGAEAGVAQMVRAFTDGVLYLDGGWQQLVDGLHRVATQRGVTITHGKATGVARRGDRFAVVADGAEHEADRVILAAGGPSHAAALLADLSPNAQTWASRSEPVVATCLDLAVDRLPDPTRRFAAGVDEPLYLSVHTPAARLTAGSGEIVHVMRNGPDDGTARAAIEGFLDDIQTGWRDRVIQERFGRQLTVAYSRPQPGIAAITVAVPDCPGVFVAGDWLGRPQLLADAVISSGAEAARLATS